MKKKLIGILGAVGSGKSSVSKCLEKRGCAVINADLIAHNKLSEPQVIKQLCQAFGTEILDLNKKIDRPTLAKIVFKSEDNVKTINSIIHPLVIAETQKLIKNYNNQKNIIAIVLDLPLLVEIGWDKKCDCLIFVECDEAIRESRAKKIGLKTRKELKNREKFQISLDKKTKIAKFIVKNNSDLTDLTIQVDQIFPNIVNG
jgi:dephospho-CoA kinase